jgi:glycosyltransferase involved in cell wall biosynthesis
MNILQIVSSLEEISGPANSLYLVSSGLAQKGHKVICAHYVGTQGPLVKRLLDQNIEVINLNPKNKKISRFGRAVMLLHLIRSIHKHKIEIIHAHNWDADCYAFLAAFFKDVKVFVTLHSRSYFDWMNSHKWKYNNFFIPKCTKFVCVSKKIKKEFMEKCNINENKTAVVYNCPHDDFFKPNDYDNYKKIRDEFRIKNDEILLGSVGNFTKFKGIKYLLQALEKIKNDKLKLILVGEDAADMRPGYEDFIKKNGLSDKVIFAGFRQDITEILDAIDIFVFPSTEEADPIALSEAMAKAKPVIATKIAAMLEKIEDKRTGLLINPEDSGQLKQAIEFYIKNKQQAAQIGKNARQMMQEKYSFDTMIMNYEKLYKTGLQ